MSESQLSPVTETSTVTLSGAALTRVRDLLQEENDPALGLRVFVAGGGCSGLAVWHDAGRGARRRHGDRPGGREDFCG